MISIKKNAKQDLSGAWKLACDAGNIGKDARWYEQPPEEEAKPAPVPGIIQQVFPGYHGVAWYWTRFGVSLASNPDSRYFMRFNEVDYHAEIWLNGTCIGSNEGAEFAFECNAGSALKFAGENLLVVRVINPVDEPIDNFVLETTPHRFKLDTNYGPGSLYNFGGITKGVELIAVDPVRIVDVHAIADLSKSAIKAIVTVENEREGDLPARIKTYVSRRNQRTDLTDAALQVRLDKGKSVHELSLHIDQPCLWDIDNPQLYNVDVMLSFELDNRPGEQRYGVSTGFKEFRVENGYFMLNGRRIFLRSGLTCNQFPIGQQVPHSPELLRKELMIAKACGYNMIRFIAGGAYPEQLDFCDEIGLLVYEESYASWYLSDSERMGELYDRSMLGIIKRDRNHPSVAIWGLLNETREGAVFRHAVNCLGKIRELDQTRLVLLNSGRWDGNTTIGSASNPGSREWEHVWRGETPESLLEHPQESKRYAERITALLNNRAEADLWATLFVNEETTLTPGDAHLYFDIPHSREDMRKLRTIGRGAKPVFLSEYGMSSHLDVIRGHRMYEQVNAGVESDDQKLFRLQEENLMEDWAKFGLDEVYAFPRDLFADSYRQYNSMRLMSFNLVRSNPQISGFSMTSYVDEVISGSGFVTNFRELKPGIADVLTDGWSPLRWCLFVDSMNGYRGSKFTFEAVLANDNALKPGSYPVQFKISGPKGVIWEKSAHVVIREYRHDTDSPLAVEVLCEEVQLDVEAGKYEFAAYMLQGGAPAGGRTEFFVSEPGRSGLEEEITWLGIGEKTEDWLSAQGINGSDLSVNHGGPDKRKVILVGAPATEEGDLSAIDRMIDRIAAGGCAIFLSYEALKKLSTVADKLKIPEKGKIKKFYDGFYHKEGIAKAHPVFDGLQSKGIMDWKYYGELIPHHAFDPRVAPDDTAAVAIAIGYCDSESGKDATGYSSGALFAGYRFGQGYFYINTFPVLENLGLHPAADRLLLNMIHYAAAKSRS